MPLRKIKVKAKRSGTLDFAAYTEIFKNNWSILKETIASMEASEKNEF